MIPAAADNVIVRAKAGGVALVGRIDECRQVIFTSFVRKDLRVRRAGFLAQYINMINT
jgi:hypothetical protein